MEKNLGVVYKVYTKNDIMLHSERCYILQIQNIIELFLNDSVRRKENTDTIQLVVFICIR